MIFTKALNFCLKWEGIYSDDPLDPGGETKYGISKRAYPYLNIKNLTMEQAAAIYKRDYWDAAGCNECNDPKLAMSIFDASVNVGVERVKGWLARDFVLWKIDAEKFNDRRERYYLYEVKEILRNRYLNGWLRRLGDLRKEVTKL